MARKLTLYAALSPPNGNLGAHEGIGISGVAYGTNLGKPTNNLSGRRGLKAIAHQAIDKVMRRVLTPVYELNRSRASTGDHERPNEHVKVSHGRDRGTLAQRFCDGTCNNDGNLKVRRCIF